MTKPFRINYTSLTRNQLILRVLASLHTEALIWGLFPNHGSSSLRHATRFVNGFLVIFVFRLRDLYEISCKNQKGFLITGTVLDQNYKCVLPEPCLGIIFHKLCWILRNKAVNCTVMYIPLCGRQQNTMCVYHTNMSVAFILCNIYLLLNFITKTLFQNFSSGNSL